MRVLRRYPYLVFSAVIVSVTLCGAFLSLGGYTYITTQDANNTPSSPESVDASPTLPLDIIIRTPNAENASDDPTNAMTSAQRETLNDDLDAIEGVSEVRVLDIRPFQGGWIAFLEIDTETDFDTIATAAKVRDTVFEFANNAPVEFSVILWDRVGSAINYTWNGTSQQWLTTTLAGRPG